MKFIMYHYVRPPCPDLPYFRFLELSDFRRQLDYFNDTFGFVAREKFLAVLNGDATDESGVVLTFDDGVLDHYLHVLPELERRGLWGLFYVPTGMYQRGKLLDVHRIHLLLGRFGGSTMLAEVRKLIREEMLSAARVDEFRHRTYAQQSNDAATTEFKRMLNYYVSPDCRECVLDELMKRFACERRLVDEYYISPNLLAEMRDRGALIGGHSVSHPVFATLHEDDQRREIDECFTFLDEAIGSLPLRTFCYPYGGFHSFTRDTERLLNDAGCRFAMNVEPRDALADDFRTRPQALPRYDCNAFPHGQSRLQFVG